MFNGLMVPIKKMHNHYAYIYNELVWNVLKDTVGEEEAVLFARSASLVRRN